MGRRVGSGKDGGLVGRTVQQVAKKTLILPIHPKTTNRKLKILRRLAARWTYGVQLYLDKIFEGNTSPIDLYNAVADATGLNKNYTQNCRDKASQMYRSYRRLHRLWAWRVRRLRAKLSKETDPKKARRLDRQLKRLVQAEPSKPRITGRIPVDIDERCGSFELSNEAREFKAWVKISTLEKRVRVAVPLIFHEYAEKTLDNGWKARSFKVLYRRRLHRWEVHLAVERTIEVTVKDFVGIDLGIKRLAVAYSAGHDRVVYKAEKTRYKDFFQRLHELNNRYSRAQRLDIKPLLKKLSRRRRNMVADLQRKLARRLAKKAASGRLVYIGLPRHIREACGRDFSSRRQRKMIHRWPYRQFANALALKTVEFNGFSVITGEHRSTKMCSACRMNKCRHCRQHRYAKTTIADRKFRCQCCGLEMDRDANAAKNIALTGLKTPLRNLKKRSSWGRRSHAAVGVRCVTLNWG